MALAADKPLLVDQLAANGTGEAAPKKKKISGKRKQRLVDISETDDDEVENDRHE